MKQLEVYRQDFTLYDSAHQKHIKACVDIPQGCQWLKVFFNYQPIVEEDYQALVRAFNKEGYDKTEVQEDTRVRNLLTLTINDGKGFRGAHHYFNDHQEILIGEEEASLGFMPGEIEAGEWEFIISCHGIFSDKVTGSLRVEVGLYQDYNFVKAVPLSQITEVVQNYKERPLLEVYSSYQRLELHAHTHHSDASQTTQSLLDQARQVEIEWLAITDHNTTSAIHEAVAIEPQRKIIPGLEYTTFHGHMVIHGQLDKIDRDWTEMNRVNVAEILEELQNQGMHITIAHPFDMGNPHCTGCRWDYALENLAYIDSIEVWNSENPHQSSSNQQAFKRWVELLNMGYEINATSGRDWHKPCQEEDRVAYTYALLSQEANLDEVLHSLKLGRTYVSLGPIIDKFVVNGRYQIGDRIGEEIKEWNLILEAHQLDEAHRLDIYSNRGLIDSHKLQDTTIQLNKTFADEQDQYIRLEIYNGKNELLAFTNPIYR